VQDHDKCILLSIVFTGVGFLLVLFGLFGPFVLTAQFTINMTIGLLGVAFLGLGYAFKLLSDAIE
jgi:uncharacterized membrane protein